MIIHVTDAQTVGEAEDVLFSVIQQSPISMLISLSNTGVNTVNYRFQSMVNGVWTDMATLSPANDLNSTLSAAQTKSILVNSNYAQVRLVGNASGGAQVDFSVTRYAVRASKGPIPILNL